MYINKLNCKLLVNLLLMFSIVSLIDTNYLLLVDIATHQEINIVVVKKMFYANVAGISLLAAMSFILTLTDS